jgi:uncharacterized protein with HEPN domain
MNRDLGTVLDIILACRDIAQFINGLDQGQFKADSLTHAATKYQLTIIGEAVNRLSKEFREKHPTMPWKEIAGMRDRLIHGYDKVNLDLVWLVVTTEVPKLRQALEPLVPDEDSAK